MNTSKYNYAHETNPLLHTEKFIEIFSTKLYKI